MKRFYTLMLSAAVCSMAMAAAFTTHTAPTANFKAEVMHGISTPKASRTLPMSRGAMVSQSATGFESSARAVMKKSPRRAGEQTANPIAGTYIMTVGDYYSGSESRGEVKATCQATMLTADSVSFDSDEFFYPVNAAVKDNVLTFDTEFFEALDFDGETLYFFVEPFEWVEADQDIKVTSFTATYNTETDSIEFPAEHGFCWVAYTDMERTSEPDYWGVLDVISMAKDNSTWTKLEGKATWYEDLFTVFSNVPAGNSWEVDIEECDQTPGRYRLQPYAVPSAVTEMFGETDNTYVYINATDPEKTYIDGDVTFYGSFLFSHVVEENDWDASLYATVKDKVIYFPAKSVYYQGTSGWVYAATNGDFKVAMPGAVVKDYSITATNNGMCSADGRFEAAMTYGADVASIKFFLTPGYFVNSERNSGVVDNIGTAGTKPETLTADIDKQVSENTLYSLLVNAYDADGAIVAYTTTHYLAVVNNDDKWKDYGTAEFTDGFLPSLFDMDAPKVKVNVQEDSSAPGHFRFSTPYAEMNSDEVSVFDHAGQHDHYIYVDATRPDSVYVEVSPLGFTTKTFGAPFGWSVAAYYLSNNQELKAVAADKFGKMTGNTITIPAKASYITFSNHPYNNLYVAEEMKFEMTKKEESAISELNAASDAAGAIYNLRGQRVSRPAVPGIYIRNNAKIMVR